MVEKLHILGNILKLPKRYVVNYGFKLAYTG